MHNKIAALKAKMQELQAIETQLEATPDKQNSLADPDARSMKTRGSGLVGYNMQAAVDTKHHLIVTHEVTNDGVDRDQLSAMAAQAREGMGVEELSVVADRGYFKGEEILACHEAGITAFVPKAKTSAAAAGRFGRDDFIYDAAHTRCVFTRPGPFSADHSFRPFWSNPMQSVVRANANGWPSAMQIRPRIDFRIITELLRQFPTSHAARMPYLGVASPWNRACIEMEKLTLLHCPVTDVRGFFHDQRLTSRV